MKTLQLDLQHSLRILRKDPAYTCVVILLLTLGIGANSAIFSVANAVLLRPLPYAEPERIVVTLHGGNSPVSPADFFDYKKSVVAFEGMAAAQAWGGTLTGRDRPEQIPGLRVSANMMDLLGVRPLLGRSFTADEEHTGRSNVLLLSYGLWQQRFGRDPGIAGRQVLIDRVSYTVLGVMPSGFSFAPFWSTRARMWSPLDLDKRLNDRSGRSLRAFARLKPGVTLAQAQAQMDVVAKRLEQLYPQTNAKLGIDVVPLHEKVVSGVRPTLLVLLGTVGFVLLIACATVGNLMLSRAVSRRKEMGLRLALGASRRDLVRLAMTEALLLAMTGGILGMVAGSWAVDFLAQMLPPGSIPRQAELGFDKTALLFAAVLTLFSALIAGVIPAVQAMRGDVNNDLKAAGRGTTEGPRRSSTRAAFIALEVALSLALMAGAGLMTRTMIALQSVDAGFDPGDVTTMQVAVSGTDYDAPGRRADLFRQVRDRLASVTGVQSVSAINHLPIGGDIWKLNYSIDGRPSPAPGDELGAVYRVVMPGYFDVMQIRLLKGRDFTAFDNERSSAVVIINEAMAKRRWPGEDPIGKTLRYGMGPDDHKLPRSVVAVVRNARQSDWTSEPDDEIYLPYFQRPDAMGLSYLTFVLRTRGNLEAVEAAAVRQIAAFHRSLPVSEVAAMERIIADALWRQRLASLLMGCFAGLSLLLAAAGVYGVISYSIRHRTQEIGIRMALGADRNRLIQLIFREGMTPVLFGIAGGLTGALWLSRFMQTLLFGVVPTDPVTFLTIVVMLTAVCAAATLIPAWRASRVDPLVALRHD